MGRRRTVHEPLGGFSRIAVIRLSSLGDVVLTLPVVHALARRFPDAHLTFWVKEEYADVVAFDPAIHHVRRLERDARRLEDLVSMSAELEDHDLIVDLHGNLRSRVLTFRQKARLLGAPADRLIRARWVHARWSRPPAARAAVERYAAALRPLGVTVDGLPRVEAGADAESWANTWFEAWKPGRAPLALGPGARHFTKRWPEDHWLSLHERLARSGEACVYFSLDSERRAMPRLAARVDADPAARWCCEPIARIAALLSRCRAAVTCDSGLMHLAAARGLRVIAMFGSTVPELGFAPAGAGHRVLCRHERCQPCTLHGRESCPKRHFDCMMKLDPDTVLGSIAESSTT